VGARNLRSVVALERHDLLLRPDSATLSRRFLSRTSCSDIRDTTACSFGLTSFRAAARVGVRNLRSVVALDRHDLLLRPGSATLSRRFLSRTSCSDIRDTTACSFGMTSFRAAARVGARNLRSVIALERHDLLLRPDSATLSQRFLSRTSCSVIQDTTAYSFGMTSFRAAARVGARNLRSVIALERYDLLLRPDSATLSQRFLSRTSCSVIRDTTAYSFGMTPCGTSHDFVRKRDFSSSNQLTTTYKCGALATFSSLIRRKRSS